MKLLITGGAGFIGSNFIFFQLKKNPIDSIVCVDKLTYAGNLNTLESVLNRPQFKFYKADINSRIEMESIFEKERPDIVINFAAESHVDRSIHNPEIFLFTNILGTQVLLDMSRKYLVKRYHQVSTDEVYGDLPLDRKDLFFTESTPIHTSSPYSASKASADLIVQAYYRTYKLPVTISRCSNNYGPYHFPEKLIPLVISRALSNQVIPVYGKGENIRDWLFVEDHCEAIDLIVRKGKVGEVFNVGGHNEKTNLEVVKLILKSLNKPESLIQFVNDRAGHDQRYAIDPRKINIELGWFPKTKFEDGINQTIQWYLNNQSWIKSVLSGDYKAYFEKHYGLKQ
jgi:dTDP-glucose 4,6-dehydratase